MTQNNSIVRRTRLEVGHTQPVASPIYPSVVYGFEDSGHVDDSYEGRRNGTGYTYAREGHPNARVVAEKIDQLEGVNPAWGEGVVTSSGMAAISVAVLSCLKAGDHIIGGNQLYGRSLRMMTNELPALGFETSLVDSGDAAAVAAAIKPNTKMILIEVVANPTIRIADLVGIAQVAKANNVLLAVDNTFTTPRGLNPFEYGADIVIHSITKLLAGHSDATLGYTVARDADLNVAIADASKTWGFTPSPFDCWLAERGLHSFDLRYDRAEANARALAELLDAHPKVQRTFYPALASHPDAARAWELLSARPGTMLSFDLGDDRALADRFIVALEHLPFAPSLGDVATMISHPPTSSHRGLTREGRAALGITEGFLRVSVGIEDSALLLREFEAALAAV